MRNGYYYIRMYAEEYPSSINCQELLEMADEISELIGCNYDRLGYCLLHPDYDFKDVGVCLKHNKKNRKKFTEMSIPQLYYGQIEEEPASPTIEFFMEPENEWKLSFYSIEVDYPMGYARYACVKIAVKETLAKKEITLEDFNKLQNIVNSRGFVIDSAFVDYYLRNSARRFAFTGTTIGIVTVNEWRIIDHAMKFVAESKDRIMDVFYMNSFNKKIISSAAKDKIVEIVGHENIIEKEEKIIFKLPQSKTSYLLNKFWTTRKRRYIKRILEKENVCFKDASIIASILQL